MLMFNRALLGKCLWRYTYEREALVSRWGTNPRLVFGTMCGFGNDPLILYFRSCLALLALRMLPRLIIFSSLMALLRGILIC
jgi:hypothetical protein